MKTSLQITILLLFVLVCKLSATTISDSVFLQYEGETLAEVLTDIEVKYQIQFSYSSDKIPVNQKIYASVEAVDIHQALVEILDQTQVAFEFIGDQVVLAFDKNKKAKAPDFGFFESRKDLSHHEPMVREVRLVVNPAPFIPTTGMNIKPMKYPSFVESVTGKPLPLDFSGIDLDKASTKNSPNFHVSLIYPLGLHTVRNPAVPTQVGLHMTIGVDQTIEGVQFSGLGGTILNGMEGAQVSGLFNGVLGESTGAQFAGLVNFAKDKMNGLQAAGIANTSMGGDHLVQLGGIANLAVGKSEFQLAGIVNVAEHVKKGQIAGIINVAKKVDGFQLGLINIADTINGPAIGLLSFARNGYHSFELAAQESIHSNMTLRLGTRQFYNLFKVGSRVDEYTWALGYGIGTSLKMGPKHLLQFEVVSSHVNEKSWWTNRLNLLNQAHLTANFRFGKHFSVALGPTFNLAVSQVYNEETDTYGMNLGQNYFFNKTYMSANRSPVNVKSWLGFHAGIRFSSN